MANSNPDLFRRAVDDSNPDLPLEEASVPSNQKKNKSSMPCLLDNANKVIIDNKSKTNLLNEYFFSVFTCDDGSQISGKSMNQQMLFLKL